MGGHVVSVQRMPPKFAASLPKWRTVAAAEHTDAALDAALSNPDGWYIPGWAARLSPSPLRESPSASPSASERRERLCYSATPTSGMGTLGQDGSPLVLPRLGDSLFDRALLKMCQLKDHG